MRLQEVAVVACCLRGACHVAARASAIRCGSRHAWLPGGRSGAILGLAVFIFVAGIAFWWTVNNSLPEPQPQGAECEREEVAPEIPLDVPLEPEEPVAEQPVLGNTEPTVPVLGELIWPWQGMCSALGWYFSDTYQDWRFNQVGRLRPLPE